MFIDLCFPVQGQTIAVDHAYSLYGAICRVQPRLHDDPQRQFGVQSINGVLLGDRLLRVSKNSMLRLRMPSHCIPEFLCLVGKEMELDGALIHLGAPEVRALSPAEMLQSRCVTIKNAMAPQDFQESVKAALVDMGIEEADLQLKNREKSVPVNGGKGVDLSEAQNQYLRRTLTIRDKQIVGYAVTICGLSGDDSLLLQQQGLGGRRHFGCGIFTPVLSKPMITR